MKTIKLALPWTIENIAKAMGEPVANILIKLIEMGAPSTVTQRSTLDPDLAKLVALKYCCYLEADNEGDDRRTSN